MGGPILPYLYLALISSVIHRSKLHFAVARNIVCWSNTWGKNLTSRKRRAYIYVICRPGGPYWEKLCQRSWVRPKAAGRGPYPRPRAQFFPIRTDLGRQITCLLFSSVEYFVSSFCVEFSLQPFSNLVYACNWHLGNRKSNQHYAHWRKLRNCLFLRSLFTFYVLCSENKKLLEKTRKREN